MKIVGLELSYFLKSHFLYFEDKVSKVIILQVFLELQRL